MEKSRKRRIMIRILCTAATVAAAVSAVLYFRPDIYLRLMQAAGFVEGEVNSFEAKNETEMRTLENGIRFIRSMRLCVFSEKMRRNTESVPPISYFREAAQAASLRASMSIYRQTPNMRNRWEWSRRWEKKK